MRPLLLLLAVFSLSEGRAQLIENSSAFRELQNMPLEMSGNWSYEGLEAGSYQYQAETIYFLNASYSVHIDSATYLVGLSLYERSLRAELESDADILWSPEIYYAVEETGNVSFLISVRRQNWNGRQDYHVAKAIHDELKVHFQKHYNDY